MFQQVELKSVQLDLLLRQSPVIFFSISDSRYFEYAFGDGLARLGLQAVDFVGQSVEDMFTSCPQVIEYIEEAFKGKAFNKTVKVKDESFFEFRFSYSKGQINEVQRVFIVAVDVSDANLQKQQAYQFHYQLELFIKNTNSAVAIFDNDMNYLMVSDVWAAQHNLDVNNIIGQNHYEVAANIPQRWRDSHQRALNGATESSDKDVYLQADGTEVHIKWTVTPWYKRKGDIGGILIFVSEV